MMNFITSNPCTWGGRHRQGITSHMSKSRIMIKHTKEMFPVQGCTFDSHSAHLSAKSLTKLQRSQHMFYTHAGRTLIAYSRVDAVLRRMFYEIVTIKHVKTNSNNRCSYA